MLEAFRGEDAGSCLDVVIPCLDSAAFVVCLLDLGVAGVGGAFTGVAGDLKPFTPAGAASPGLGRLFSLAGVVLDLVEFAGDSLPCRVVLCMWFPEP